MAVGSSGRIVVDVDVDLKRRLHAVLAARGESLKAWFIDQAERLLESHRQPELFPESMRDAPAKGEGKG